MSDWDDMQIDGVRRTKERLNSHGSVVLCAPTGCGKTKMATMMIDDICVPEDMPWEFLTHRRSLLEQSGAAFSKRLDFGVRGAGFTPQLYKRGQVTIWQTDSINVRKKLWVPHKPELLIIDEVHGNLSRYVRDRVEEHVSLGKPVVGLSATPIPGLRRFFRSMETVCTLSRLREVGGALMAKVVCPNEVDLRDIKKFSIGTDREEEKKRRFTQQQVVGSVIDIWKQENPQGWPTIQFNPCVESSKWFTDEWIRHGIPAAHIDANHIYFGKYKDGERVYVPASKNGREKLKKAVNEGRIKVINNRFIMREGVDWPFLYHAIFATKMTNPVPWVQSCGRVLRSCPPEFHRWCSMRHVVIQDHGGNVWVPGLGNPNVDREWSLDDTPRSVMAAANNNIRDGKAEQNVCCPRCRRMVVREIWRSRGNRCPYCSNAFDTSERIVIQTNGTLKVAYGDALKIKVRTESYDIQRAWDKLYFPSKNTKSPRANTFAQIGARFKQQYPHLMVTSGIVKRPGGGSEKVSGIRDKRTGTFYPINNIPRPDSPAWKFKANSTNSKLLQHGEGQNAGQRQGDAGSGTGVPVGEKRGRDHGGDDRRRSRKEPGDLHPGEKPRREPRLLFGEAELQRQDRGPAGGDPDGSGDAGPRSS